MILKKYVFCLSFWWINSSWILFLDLSTISRYTFQINIFPLILLLCKIFVQRTNLSSICFWYLSYHLRGMAFFVWMDVGEVTSTFVFMSEGILEVILAICYLLWQDELCFPQFTWRSRIRYQFIHILIILHLSLILAFIATLVQTVIIIQIWHQRNVFAPAIRCGKHLHPDARSRFTEGVFGGFAKYTICGCLFIFYSILPWATVKSGVIFISINVWRLILIGYNFYFT